MATQLSGVYEIFSRQSGRGARDTCDRGGAENGRSVLAWKTRKNSACSTGYVRDYCLFVFSFSVFVKLRKCSYRAAMLK